MTAAKFCVVRRLGRSCRCEENFNPWIVAVNVFVEMRFDNPVVVQSETFAKRILRNLEPSIHIPPQGGRKVKADR
jgi:hypothetical protein